MIGSGTNRIFGLDLLRAFAVLFVVYGHGYNMLSEVIPKYPYLILFFDGVTMFFVLSGFLIGRILLRTVAKDDFSGQTLTQFWIRRWFRTLPNYFLVLTVLVVVFYVNDWPLPEGLIKYFFFAQSIAAPHPDFFPEAWSLAVEEWFYLVIPIPLYLSTKLRNIDKRRLMLLWIAATVLLVTAFRIYRAYRFNYSTVRELDLEVTQQVLPRFDSLMFGVLGAYVSLYHPHRWHGLARVALVAGICLLLFDKVFFAVTRSLFYAKYFTLTLSAVGTLLLLPTLSSWQRTTGWFVSAVTFVSLTSYSMYLLNFTPVSGIILPAAMSSLSRICLSCSQNEWLQYTAYWIITVSASYLLYRYFERPMTALREKWPAHGHGVVTAFAAPRVRAKSAETVAP